MGKKGFGSVRWVGDAALIAENKSATNWQETSVDDGQDSPRSGGGPGIGTLRKSKKSGAVKAATKLKNKPAEKKPASKPAEKKVEPAKVEPSRKEEVVKPASSSAVVKKKKK